MQFASATLSWARPETPVTGLASGLTGLLLDQGGAVSLAAASSHLAGFRGRREGSAGAEVQMQREVSHPLGLRAYRGWRGENFAAGCNFKGTRPHFREVKL